jgi:hypothetical protein
MSISAKWLNSKKNIDNVLRLYRSSDIKTMAMIALELGTTYQTVSKAIRDNMGNPERKALAMLRYSASKMGSKNPMKGKFEEQHHNWKGECDDHHGYMTIKRNGKRQFTHRKVMADALGLKRIPLRFDVHHIDENPLNNDLDNLAIVTRKAHKTIHSLQRSEPKSLKLKKLRLAEVLKYMTSP